MDICPSSSSSFVDSLRSDEFTSSSSSFLKSSNAFSNPSKFSLVFAFPELLLPRPNSIRFLPADDSRSLVLEGSLAKSSPGSIGVGDKVSSFFKVSALPERSRRSSESRALLVPPGVSLLVSEDKSNNAWGFLLTRGLGDGVGSSSCRGSSSNTSELGRELEDFPGFRRTTPEVFFGDELNCSLSCNRSVPMSSLLGLATGLGSVKLPDSAYSLWLLPWGLN